ncbi:NADH-quinone oxidoreductase subunit NuoN [Cellulomonas soli]
MSTFTAPTIAWAQLSPVVIVLLAAVLGVLVEAFVPAARRRVVQLVLAFVALAGALVAVAALWNGAVDSGGTTVLGGSLVIDGPALALQGIIALLALVATLVVADRTDTGEDAFAPLASAVPGSEYEELTRQHGLQQTEVFPLVLFATGGMLIFPATGDLLTLFVALEVLSLPLYLLTGMARRRRLLSQEASMKYFLLGAFASALMLFGIALLYGYSGSLRFSEIAAATADPSGLDALLLVGALLVVSGLLFKIGAVPFHAWTPDVYQGAPTPITGFMGACTKVAAAGALLRFVYVVIPGLQWDLQGVLWAVAILTMLVGTVVALVQTDVKRMLAYSSIAHAGFLLTGVVALEASGVAAVIFYLLVYGAATVGAFGIVSVVRERVAGPDDADGEDPGTVLGEATHLSQWAGLGRRHPLTALTFTVFLLSFAGIPLTAGFIGKFTVFSAAVAGGAWPLAAVGVAASAAAAFFYVRVVVLMFFTAPTSEARGVEPGTVAGADVAADTGAGADLAPADAAEGAEPGTAAVATLTRPAAATTTTVVATEGFTAVAVAVCALVTIVLGVFPSPVLELLDQAARFLP